MKFWSTSFAVFALVNAIYFAMSGWGVAGVLALVDLVALEYAWRNGD